MFTASDIEALATLLVPPDEEEDCKTNDEASMQTSQQPQSYHPFLKQAEPIPESEKNFPTVITSTRQIYEEEKSDEKEIDTTSSLPEPKYSIIYQQKLTAKDVAFIDPFSTSHSDSILIKIILPGIQYLCIFFRKKK